MNRILDLSVAINAIRTAFQPLICIVEVYGYESRLRFRVIGPDKRPLLKVVGISMRDALDPTRLRTEMQDARARIEAKGFTLTGWIPPS